MRKLAILFALVVIGITITIYVGGFVDGDNGAYQEAGWAWDDGAVN